VNRQPKEPAKEPPKDEKKTATVEKLPQAKVAEKSGGNGQKEEIMARVRRRISLLR